MTYLDWASTAIPRDNYIKEALELSINQFGNPSSQHSLGIEAKDLLNNCRKECADILGCSENSLFLTSGATESNNIALLSFLKKHTSGELITTSIEHPSVIEPLNVLSKFGWKVKTIDPAESGKISIKKLKKSLNEKTKLVSIIYVHNETGIIQPINEIVEVIREKEIELESKIHIHLDGVQAVGKIDVNIERLNVDSFSLSGHKFGAPKGVGLLYLKNMRDPIYRGGGQESGIRSGTENLFGAIALTKCLTDAVDNISEVHSRLNNLMDILITGVRELGVSTIPKERELSSNDYIPNILSLTAPPLPGEVLARVLDGKGFMISTGSACSSNKKSNTKGILSMGITKDEGFSSFRVSIGRTTSKNDITNFLKALKETLEELAP